MSEESSSRFFSHDLSLQFEEVAMQHIQTYDQAIQDTELVDNLISNLETVGKKHKKLPGFREEYFVRMEKCLVFALQTTLGDAYTGKPPLPG